jgi:ppGpp synthetase/RelA/SpoT-type nucleotidyltranferase
LEEAQIDKVHSVVFRAKTEESLAGKVSRPDKSYASLSDVTDLLGVRVIVFFEDDVDRVGRLLEAKLPVEWRHSRDRRADGDARAFGYRSLHYVSALPPELAPSALPAALRDDPPFLGGLRFELQVRTVLEHAWAEIEHDLAYKVKGPSSEAAPLRARRRLHRLAGLLELADQEFAAVRRELTQYVQRLPSQIAAEGDAVELDALSLSAWVRSVEVEQWDESIATALGVGRDTDVFFPDYLARMLRAAGLRTVSATRRAAAPHRARFPSLALAYFSFALETWGLDPLSERRQLPAGYSLFFIAHAHLLSQDELDVNRVARLAQFYRELDYPHDPDAARTLAEGLLAAWRNVFALEYE